MKIVRNIALAIAAAMALGSAALAQESHKPHGKRQSGEKHEMRGGCHGDAAERHDHS